jgi:hypothetical protein
MILDKELVILLKDIIDGKFGNAIAESEFDRYYDVVTLVEHGYLDALDSSNLKGKRYQNFKPTTKGNKALSEFKPVWKSWDKGWKKWLGAIVLIFGVVIAGAKVLSLFTS